MAKQATASGSDGIPDYNTVFIDTSLDTHLITVVSSSETVSDLKKKVVFEHALCFPHIGEIKIHGLKVKRRGKFYYLSESMLVKSVFHGVNKNWFIAVDASSLEERNGNGNFLNPLSNNLLAPVGMMNIALDYPALPESHSNPELLTNVNDNQLQKQIDSCDQRLASDVAGGDGSRNMEIGVKLMEDTRGEAKPIDANDESFPSMQEKDDHSEKEKEIKNTPKASAESIFECGICDKPGSIPSEERAAETTPDKKRRHKRKWNHNEFASKEDNAEVPKSSMLRSETKTEESESSLGNANGVISSNDDAIDGPSTNPSPEANEGRGTIVQRLTILSERTRELEKLVELNNPELRENSVDVLQDQSLKGNPQVEPAAKRRRSVKQAKKGDGDTLIDDGTMVSESNKVSLEHSTISQKSLLGKQHRRNATLDGSSIGTPEAVHLQLLSPSNKKRKGEKKSAKTFNHEAAAVPSSMTNDGVEHFDMPNNSSNLGEISAAALASGQHAQDVISSEPEAPIANYPKDKQRDTAKEINLRPSSLDIDIKNKEVGNLEGGHEVFGAAIESNIKRKRVLKDHRVIYAEDNSCAKVQASDTKEKKSKISRHGNEIHSSNQNQFSNQNDGVVEHQNHFSGQNDRVDEEREFSVEFSPKTASSENYKTSAQDDLHLKAKEPIVGSKLLEAGENVDPPKSSKKRKKSKKTKDLVTVTPSTSVTEHVKGFINSTSPTEPHKVAKGDHPNDTLSKEEISRFPEVRKEMDTVSTSFVATDKEINDVIQNVVESVERMGKEQVGPESIHGKSRKKSRKKQNEDAKLLPESTKQNENVGYNNAGDMEYSSEVTKQACVANTGCTNDLIGSLLECGKDTTAVNDRGIQSAQVLAQKLESNSKKRYPETVISGSPSISGSVNESIHGKARKKSRKKQNEDAKLRPESTKQNENVGYNNAGDMEYSSEVTKQACVANTGCTNALIGSLLECGKDTTAVNDRGIQSAQVLAQKLESNSKKKCPETVISGSPSISGGVNEVTGDVDITCESNGVNFNDYFAPKKHDPESVVSGEMPVDEATKTNGSHGMAKAKKKTKKKKHDAYSDGPTSDLKTPLMLKSNHGVEAKLHTGGSTFAEVQVSFTKANSEKGTLKSNKESSKASDRGAEPLVSSNPDKVNSVLEEARRSNDAKPTGMVNGSKSKKAESNLVSSNPRKLNSVPEEALRSNDAKPTGMVNGSKSEKAGSNLESSKNSSFLRTRINGHQSLEGHDHNDAKKASTIKNGEIVNSLNKEKSLVGVSGSIFKDDSDEASSNEDNDSDASTRTPSDVSLSSDYSDGESNADLNMSQYGSSSRRGEDGGTKTIAKPFSSEMTLDKILRSSSSYKKAKLTASQSQVEDTESQPLDFVQDSQA